MFKVSEMDRYTRNIYANVQTFVFEQCRGKGWSFEDATAWATSEAMNATTMYWATGRHDYENQI